MERIIKISISPTILTKAVKMNPTFENLVKEALDQIRDASSSYAEDAIKSFEYIGFDPEKIQEELINKNATGEDLIDLCALFLQRGNNYLSAKKRMSADGVMKINALQKKFNLAINLKNSSNKTLTLARVANVCPLITYHLYSTHSGKRNFDLFKLPTLFHHVLFSSLLPINEMTGSDLKLAMDAYVYVSAMESVMYDSKTYKKTDVDLLAIMSNNKKFVSATMGTTITTQSYRAKFARGCSCFEETATHLELSSTVKSLLSDLQSWVRGLKGSENLTSKFY